MYITVFFTNMVYIGIEQTPRIINHRLQQPTSMKQTHISILLLACLLFATPVVSWNKKDTSIATCAAVPVKKPTKKTSKAIPAKNKKKTARRSATTSAKQDAAITYQQKVEAVEKHNAKVATYMTRDISHRIGLWGNFGYSVIFPSAFSPTTATQGFNVSAIGGAGGGGGIGYQLRYKQFLFSTGAEFQMYNSHTNITPFERSFGMKPYEKTMRYTYSYTDTHDYWKAGYLQIPLLFGMELSDWYWQAGVKAGFNVIGNSIFTTSLSTAIHDDELISDLSGIHAHALFNDIPVEHKQNIRFGCNAAFTAEIGLSLDRWTRPAIKKSKKLTAAQKLAKNLHYRVALFAEYGALNILNFTSDNGTTDIPANFDAVINKMASAPEDLYNNVRYCSTLSTSTAQHGHLAPFLVGAKVSIWYELPRKTKKMLPLPSEPRPRMAMQVTNAETGQRLSGAQLRITKESDTTRQTHKTTNSKGMVVARLQKGTYIVSASKIGFVTSDTVTYQHKKDLQDTLFFALQPEPRPIPPMLCGYVLDAETHSPLEAEMRIVASADTTTVYNGSTNEEGFFATKFTAGAYLIQTTCKGYMPATTTIIFEQDTISLEMTAIKEGIKTRIDHLYFATNKTVVLPQSEEALNALAAFLHDNPNVSIRIIGHTDAVGSDDANMRLSLGRARSVRTALVQRGIDAERILFEGRGETEPIATNDTEEGRALNRRVEFEIISTE